MVRQLFYCYRLALINRAVHFSELSAAQNVLPAVELYLLPVNLKLGQPSNGCNRGGEVGGGRVLKISRLFQNARYE